VGAVGSALAPLSNWAQNLPGADLINERVLGIAPDRKLPNFRRETLVDWFDARGPQVPGNEAEDKVLLFPDTYTNYSYPAPGKAAVEVLEAADIHVRVLDGVEPSGRAAFSMGMLDLAKERAEENVGTLAPHLKDGWSVLFVEPSDAAMFQDEYRDLLDGEDVATVAAGAYGVCEYLSTHRVYERIDFEDPGETLTYHGHCNQKALNRHHHTTIALREAGYEVDELDSGCCGMAGSFGYEAEHYDLSKAIGRILYDRVEESPGETVVAPGASCRTQLSDREGGERPPHPAEKLRDALA
jgi:Fe-S oxidoreductase